MTLQMRYVAFGEPVTQGANLLKLTVLGMEFVGLVVGGTLLGAWIDGFVSTSLPVGVVLGAMSGLLVGIRLALSALAEDKEPEGGKPDGRTSNNTPDMDRD